jgi:hypothetical protein
MSRIANDFMRMYVTRRDEFVNNSGNCRGDWQLPERVYNTPAKQGAALAEEAGRLYVVRVKTSGPFKLPVYVYSERTDSWFGINDRITLKDRWRKMEPYGVEVQYVDQHVMRNIVAIGVAGAIRVKMRGALGL